MFSRLRRSSFELHVTLPSHALGLALGLALALSPAGCSRFTKIKQCRSLIAQVNPALDEVLTLTDGGARAAGGAGGADGASNSGASARYVSAAARYERLAKDLGPMEFSSEQMAKSVAEYAGVLSSTAQTLRTLAAALEANSPGEADRANRELERLDIRERSAVSRIDAWCQAD